jgi:flagellar basal-body rod protein FlgB
MPTSIIDSKTITLLEKSLNLRSLQHKVLSSNIANMDTPNYKAVELAVEEEINSNHRPDRGIQLRRTCAGHLPIQNKSSDNVKLRTAKPPELSLRGDGNTVDIDRTMGQLAENTLLYKTATQLISKKFIGLKNVIKGGGN